jgi:hypothetical protein
MPGPSNKKGKKQRAAKRQQQTKPQQPVNHPPPGPAECLDDERARSTTASPQVSILDQPALPSADDYISATTNFTPLEEHIPSQVEQVMFQEPFIHDPGNGPRVRDAKAFMTSFFSKPPALEVSYGYPYLSNII